VSVQPRPWPQVPDQTAAVARAAFPKGCLAMRVRDQLPDLFTDQAFATAFGVRGRPGTSPGQLALITVLQFAENLTDRQAADAVRGRIDWKYALGVDLHDPGFDHTVLTGFRDRLIQHGLEETVLELLLTRLVELGLLAAGGRQRTDSTHVLAAVRTLNRIEMVTETLRAALEALAAAAPDWLAGWLPPEWITRYPARVDAYRLPGSDTKRRAWVITTGADGYQLLQATHASGAPHWLRHIPAVVTLRTVWMQHYTRTITTGQGSRQDGRQEVIWRENGDLPPHQALLTSPYDPDTRYSVKREMGWNGYKIHLSETCDDIDTTSRPHLVTAVATTPATVPDVAMTQTIHTRLARQNLTPAEHVVDAGYTSAALVVDAATEHGITLLGPLLVDNSPQARAGLGFDRASFSIDFDRQRVCCPQGNASSSWTPGRHGGREVIVVKFATATCRACPVRGQCTRVKRGGRQLTVRPRALHEALVAGRAGQTTEEWKARYAVRAGVEGTMRQASAVTGIRRTRYRGLPKTHLGHVFAAAAINLVRLDAWWTNPFMTRGRTSHLARLDLALAA
jgi:transposase